MVGAKRLELLHLAALEPKSSASTNFATPPMAVYIIEKTESWQAFFMKKPSVCLNKKQIKNLCLFLKHF